MDIRTFFYFYLEHPYDLHRVFILETFSKHNQSVTALQALFQQHFKLKRHDPVPVLVK